MNASIYDLEQREEQIRLIAKESKSLRYEMARDENAKVCESVRESYGIDITDQSRFNFKSPKFSMRGMREATYRVASKFRETNPEAAFSAVLRAGVNNFANTWYQLTKTVYDQIVATTPSTHAVEPYAPIARGGIPKRVPRGTPFREVSIQAPADIQIINEKFGAISSAPQELIDDDQTSQIVDRMMDIGPNMALLEEAWVMGKFISPSGGTLYKGEIIPASYTKPSIETSSTWPWSTAMLGGGQNRLTTYIVFNQNSVQAADYILSIQQDQNGNFMAVDPDTILAGPGLKFLTAKLMNDAWYPSTVPMLAGGGQAGSTTIGGVGATSTATNIGINVTENGMKGMYRPVISRFLPPQAWALGMAHKGMTMQMRQGLSVVQEMPLSGSSFSSDLIQWRSRARWAVEVIDMRFWCLGNDGSAT